MVAASFTWVVAWVVTQGMHGLIPCNSLEAIRISFQARRTTYIPHAEWGMTTQCCVLHDFSCPVLLHGYAARFRAVLMGEHFAKETFENVQVSILLGEGGGARPGSVYPRHLPAV